jgi:hypothetical protein
MHLEKRNPGAAGTATGVKSTGKVTAQIDTASAARAQRPTITVEREGLRFWVILAWSPDDRRAIAVEMDRDAAFAEAGRARVQHDSGPVIDLTGDGA